MRFPFALKLLRHGSRGGRRRYALDMRRDRSGIVLAATVCIPSDCADYTDQDHDVAKSHILLGPTIRSAARRRLARPLERFVGPEIP